MFLPRLAALLALAAAGDSQSDSAPSFADDAVAAHAGDDRVLWRELDPVVTSRRVLSKDGREALKHLAQSTILERLAKGLEKASQDEESVTKQLQGLGYIE